jgi:quercetin dioxygenase-like cupin family protein
MIKRVAVSNKDKAITDFLPSTTPVTGNDSSEYEGLVVRKPWGFEYLLFHNKHVAGWVLHINQGNKTSMHCHPNKKTSLVVLKGEGLFSTHNEEYIIKEGEGVLIDSGVFHSTKALSDGGIIILEIETPPNKTDLYRFDDAYGREFSGYEGAESYVPIEPDIALSIPTLYNFKESYGVQKKIGNCLISIHRSAHLKQAQPKIYDSKDVLIGILNAGSAISEINNIKCGDVVHFGDFKEVLENFSDDGEVLLIEKI